MVKYRYINKRAFEDLSITRLIQMGLNALVEDLRYVINHLYVLKPCKKNSKQEVVDMGYHTGRLICDVVTAIQAGKAIATKFKNSKLGGKLIEKFKGSGNKGNPPLKMNLQYFADKGGIGSNGIYEKADYHGKVNNSVKNKAPNMGQEALDNSVPIGSNTTRRVGISDGEIVVFDETTKGIFHGHVRS